MQSDKDPLDEILIACVNEAFDAIGTEPLTPWETHPMITTLRDSLDRHGYVIVLKETTGG